MIAILAGVRVPVVEDGDAGAKPPLEGLSDEGFDVAVVSLRRKVAHPT
jgi:hypothetical protein